MGHHNWISTSTAPTSASFAFAAAFVLLVTAAAAAARVVTPGCQIEIGYMDHHTGGVVVKLVL
jgi:hypothetical protein